MIKLLYDLCMIPSFTNQEIKKAIFIKEYLTNLGCSGVYIDDACNVIYPYKVTDSNTIYIAHMDTVFREITEEYIICDDKINYPGVGDNTANIVLLIYFIKELVKKNYEADNGVIFVFDTCEEGLGNLKGSKYIYECFKGSIKEVIALDGKYDSIVNEAVGSLRYKVTIKTEGGHSYRDFGASNAIVEMSRLISKLYEIKPSLNTTYNVGVIEGGTSVNSVAQECSALFDFRSTSKKSLEKIREQFHNILFSIPYEVTKELVGNRPAGEEVNKDDMDNLINKAIDSIFKYTNKIPKLTSGSTDCNTFLANNIPSICFGGYLGAKAHTKEEYIYLSSLELGFDIIKDFIMSNSFSKYMEE